MAIYFHFHLTYTHNTVEVDSIEIGRIYVFLIKFNNFRNMMYMCIEFKQLFGLIVPLTKDYNENIPIHFCKLTHRHIQCCDNAELMHNGTHPNITIIYIPEELKQGAQIIINQLRANIHNNPGNNEDDNFIFTCPGCGTEFDEQL